MNVFIVSIQMDQKERVIRKLEPENRAAHPDQYPPPPGNFCHRCLNVGFFYNQPQSTLGISGFFLARSWMLRCRLNAEVTSGEAREACVPSGVVQKNSFERVTIKTWVKPETVHGRSLAPRVFPILHPCPDFNESRFPGSSEIPYPVNTSLIPHCILSSPGSRG